MGKVLRASSHSFLLDPFFLFLHLFVLTFRCTCTYTQARLQLYVKRATSPTGI